MEDKLNQFIKSHSTQYVYLTQIQQNVLCQHDQSENIQSQDDEESKDSDQKQQVTQKRNPIVFSEKRTLSVINPQRKSKFNLHINCQQNQQEKKKKININQFDTQFSLQDKIGQGSHSTVYKCRKNDEQADYAVKIIKYKDMEHLFSIIQEVEILSNINHVNILHYKDFFINKECKKAYLIAELLNGVTLQEYLQKKVYLEEYEARIIMRGLFSALKYLHNKKICHRDINISNIIFNKQTLIVKIIDFSVSKYYYNENHKLWTNIGTMHYKAPEIFTIGIYNKKVDIWSAGILLYQLLVGRLPFDDPSQNVQDIIDCIVQKNLEFDAASSQRITSQAKELICMLLDKNPSTRINAKAALQHPWINEKMNKSEFTIAQIKFAKRILKTRSQNIYRKKSEEIIDMIKVVN